MSESLHGVPMLMKTLKEKLNSLIPRHAKRQWQQVATFEVSDGDIIVFDPQYYVPGWIDPKHVYDLTLSGPPGIAHVYLERIQIDSK